MAIKINSFNIRRLYTKEELSISNKINESMEDIKDLKRLEELNHIKNAGIEYEPDLSSCTLEEFKENMLTESYNTPNFLYRDRKKVKLLDDFIKKNEEYIDNKAYNDFSRNDENLVNLRKDIRDYINHLEYELKNFIGIRELKDVYETDLVSLSTSELTDALGIEDDTQSDLIMIIVSNQEDMMRNTIFNGFYYKGHHYSLYSASSGQLRKTKIMYVRTKNLEKIKNRITCGLDIDEINRRGGVNINKWSAYLSLPTSCSTEWTDFDIDRVIVVDDFITILKDRKVHHIDEKYEITEAIKDVEINHTDGFCMFNPRFCKDTRMIRAPWIKGLGSPHNFHKFVEVYNGKKVLTDLWGKKRNIEDIDVILTKSQFKMWKYYDSWEHYVSNFKKYGCTFRYMNSESNKDLRLNALFNYQMWQTLELEDYEYYANKFLEDDIDLIKRGHSQVKAMQDLFYVDEIYEKNNYMNKALYLYPAIMNTEVFKVALKDKITAHKKRMRQGRIKVNGVYTYIIPDTFAWCQRLFLDQENPKGLLDDGEVFCRLVDGNKEILVNRSPHLYLEHMVRVNKKTKEQNRWFLSKGVYTSTRDMISKQIFFDVDGDISLVVDNEELVKLAKQTMKNVLPLDFKLSKASAEKITKENIFESYKIAFKVNIGYFSNLITKIMNSDDKDPWLVAKICWINNQVIDFAKTKWQIKPPKELDDKLQAIDNKKLPYFFIWAKDKKRENVAKPNKNSLVDMMAVTVDKLDIMKYNFKNIENFDINVLMEKTDVPDNKELIEEFKKMSNDKHQAEIRMRVKGSRNFRNKYLAGQLISDMYSYLFYNNIDTDDAVDIITRYVFEHNMDRDTLFIIFGDILVKRLEVKFKCILDGTHTRCQICGKLIEKKRNNSKIMYCETCSIEVDREKARKRMQTIRENKNNN